jgi:hypothetical protein
MDCGGSSAPISSVAFTSCYVYSPRAAGWVAESSRVMCRRVKSSDPLWLPRYAGCVYRSSLRDRALAELFSRDAMLVPVPGSARTGDAPWAAVHLAIALSRVGLARGIWIGLRRRYAVTKSATAMSAARPSVQQHYDSLLAILPVMPMHRIVLIDDVITKGRTLLAAAARLHSVLPSAEVRVFALIRTEGFAHHIERLEEPCHGVIRWAGGDARREP